MSECILLKGGGGADTSVVTACDADVLHGKVIVDTEGEPLVGSMPDNSVLTNSVDTAPGVSDNYPEIPTRDATNLILAQDTDGVSRLNMRPPRGYFSGAEYVSKSYSDVSNLIGLTEEKLVGGNTVLGVAGTALNDATISKTAQLRKGAIAYGKNGTKYTGTMTEKGAQTYTPGTSAQTIAANQYLTGVQTIAAIPSSYVNITGGHLLFNSGSYGTLSGGAVKAFNGVSTEEWGKYASMPGTVTIGTTIAIYNLYGNYNVQPYLAFKRSIKFNYYKYVRIRMRSTKSSRRVCPYIFAINPSTMKNEGSSSKCASSKNGTYASYVGVGTTDIDIYIDISALTTDSYLYIKIGVDSGTDDVKEDTLTIKQIELLPS